MITKEMVTFEEVVDTKSGRTIYHLCMNGIRQVGMEFGLKFTPKDWIATQDKLLEFFNEEK